MKSPQNAKDKKTDLSISGHQPLINVLHIIGTLEIGGAENQLVTLAPVLGSGHYSTHVCCLYHEGVQANTLRAKGIHVVSLNMRMRYWPIAIYKLFRLIKRLKPGVVHTHLYEAGIWGRIVAKIAGVSVIITTEHGMTLWKKRHHLIIEGFVNRFTDRMIAVSEDIRQRRIRDEGVSPDKIIMIPNAVDIVRFGVTDSRERVRRELGLETSALVIGTVARLVTAKRLDNLLEAAQMVCKAFPQARFLIIGDGPLRDELEHQAVNLGLAPQHVLFLGSRQDIPELLSAMDIFALSSEREGLPVSLLEAMAASRPVVITRVGGIPQVIQDRHNGLLVSPHDPKAIAGAILALAEDSTLCGSIAREGYRTVEAQYSINVVGQQIVALYDGLLKKKDRYRA